MEPIAGCSSSVPRVQSDEPIAGCSTTADIAPDGLSEFSDEVSAQSGSSGRRIHLYSEEVRLQWNLRKVHQTFATPDDCIRFAEENELMPREKMCAHHRSPMKLVRISQNVGTFRTIADWFSYCREAIVVYELEKQEERPMIGGPGKIVQIDESKFRKRKCNRGRHIEGHWAIGMVKDGSDDLRIELCPDNERSAEILIPIIKKHVREGSIIHTDFWKAYNCFPEHGHGWSGG
ncbi:hypothetical protein evm_012903 [Chilo suppressalis]|nr:hypothetical protein evm_012903 [Chilo suppressalis]